MKLIKIITLLFASFGFTAGFAAPATESKNCGCACCVGKEVCCCQVEEKSTEPVTKPVEQVGHPLKGIVVDVMTDQKALLVKHEEVPGVMKAMTMMLRVKDEVLTTAKKGAPVTGQLVRRGAVWWLDEVKFSEN